ncbi:UPF0053 family inner membrane protein YfjD [Gammaproteobacteria bacterium]
MNDIPLSLLFSALGLCVALAAFCAGAETGLMALNRHRLRYLMARGQRRAASAARLLEHPDRLMGLLLLGNTFFKVCAAGLAALLGWRLEGDLGIVVAAVLLTLVVLVVADLAPKTAATLNPEGVGLALAPILLPLVRFFTPLVWMLNALTRGLLWLGQLVPTRGDGGESLSREELRSVVNEVTEIVPRRHLRVLVGLLELENITVEDVMVPRAEIIGLDLTDPWPELLTRLTTTRHTHLPVYHENLDQVEGILHVRDVLPLLVRPDFDQASLRKVLRETYFIPVGTSLHTQLLHFQHHRQGLGLVVNEYGDIRGLLTLENILEEVVGEFAPEPTSGLRDIYPEPDGSYLVDGGVSVRELNRQMGWKLPMEGPKTLNGLILEHIEAIPQIGSHFQLAGYPMEVVEIGGNVVKTVRIKPEPRRWGRR